jgi:hypothetical protein
VGSGPGVFTSQVGPSGMLTNIDPQVPRAERQAQALHDAGRSLQTPAQGSPQPQMPEAPSQPLTITTSPEPLTW